MELSNPLIVRFKNKVGDVAQEGNIVHVPAFNNRGEWRKFTQAMDNALDADTYDYVALSYREVEEGLQNEKVLKSLDIKTNQILRMAQNKGLRAFNRYDDKLYFLNPSFDEQKSDGKAYIPQDKTVLEKRAQFVGTEDWEKHQSDVLKKFKTTMGLTEGGKYDKTDHKSMLLDPKRGLKEYQLDEYYSWKPYQTIVPELMDDDMVGIPSVKARTYNDITLSVNGKTLPATPLSLETEGMPGIMVPMKNPKGDAPKYQIGSDISNGNFILKARTAEGVSIKSSEYSKGSKWDREYTFTTDGEPSELKVTEADNNRAILSDINGEFEVKIKEDVKSTLENRGYDIPELIGSLKAEPDAKYVWMSQGSMVGSNTKNIFHAQTTSGTPMALSRYYKESRKGNGRYLFDLDGKPSDLRVTNVDDTHIHLKDTQGEFDVPTQGDIKDILVNRGYDLPDELHSFEPLPLANGVWESKGVAKHINPSNAGFITAREPKNGRNEYLTLVVEGALKGMIVSEYLDKPDENGVSLADTIDSTGERGIIVAQVSGTAFAFTKSVDRIYDEYNVEGTYIAFDADGRENYNVAKGIHQAYSHLGDKSPVKVLQWNPDQKGLDDALLALANHDIVVDDMDIHYGKPETLFPLDQAEKPNPYKLDGSREYSSTPSWKKEWDKQKVERDAKKQKTQEESVDVNVDLDLSGLDTTQPSNSV